MIHIFSTQEGFLEKEGMFKSSRPVLKLIYKNKILKINNKIFYTQNPLLFIETLVKKYRLYACGFISYEYGEKLLGIENKNKNLVNLPHIYVTFFRRFEPSSVQKHSKSTVKQIIHPVSKEEFINAVKKAKNYIEEGDIYQINLSLPVIVEGFFNKRTIFGNLIKIQPTPFLMLIEEKDFCLISGSMELFLKKEKNKITTKPIKGTRPRGKNPKEDELLKKELLTSEKERAENLMITDLMRNDLGKISKICSIKVENLFEVETYSSLFQMSSTVVGNLKDKISLKEIIKATFPPGSVTGTPKKRAMEIIAQLEKYKRSVYCGANILIKPNLDFVMSVAIRQIIFQKGKAVIYVGSGIVTDSVPQKEYEETLLKAKANLQALHL
ncbi:MAG: anthranilate synthase component I family protein [Aquificae bacterium]|nr:anthranilate synthase component I family protein [Aquificota bacterium]